MEKFLPLLLLPSIPLVASQCQPCDITPNGWAVRPGTGCTEYINCVAGAEASVNTCAGGTVFDHAITGCNWESMVTCPEDVECTTTTTTTTEATTTVMSTVEAASFNETAVAQDYVPLKFTVTGLSEDVDEEIVQQEMKGILQMILFELEELEKDSGLKILDIAAWGRRLVEVDASVNTGKYLIRGRRIQEDVPYEMMFNVAVMQSEGVQFGPVIIEGIRKRYDSLVMDVRGWTDSEYVTTDFSFDVCAYSEVLGGYNDCASSDGAAYDNSNAIDSTPMAVESSSSATDEGMPKMIVIIISLVGVLVFICIVSIILFLGCRKDEDSYYEPDDYSREKRDSTNSEGESSKSTAENSGQQMVLLNESEAVGYPEKCYVDEDEHNSNVLPNAGAVPPYMMQSTGSVFSNTGGSIRSHKSKSTRNERRSRRADSSVREVKSTASSYSKYSRPRVKHPDPSAYNVRENAEDPSVSSNSRRADPSVYNPNVRDPDEIFSARNRDNLSHQLESLASGSQRGGKKSSVRMDYSVVSELSEPSIADRFS